MKLGYERWGSGPRTLVALHGFAATARAWRELAPHLGERLSVLAIDLPGHGDSEPAGDAGFLGTLDAIDALCAELGITTASLLGHSLGARLALGLTLLRPGRWERLVLESGTAGLRRRKERVDRRVRDFAFAELLERDGLARFIERHPELPAFASLGRVGEAGRERAHAEQLRSTVAGLADALRTLGAGAQPNLWPYLPKLRIPALLLTGRDDLECTDTARRMAADLPLSWRRSFEGAHHAPHLEVPEAFAREVLSFLEAPWTEEELEPQPAVLGRTG
jgi:2-succinyl-6-hydroxy-2,4-cyclohexadiene-1-carboxylate synthase